MRSFTLLLCCLLLCIAALLLAVLLRLPPHEAAEYLRSLAAAIRSVPSTIGVVVVVVLLFLWLLRGIL